MSSLKWSCKGYPLRPEYDARVTFISSKFEPLQIEEIESLLAQIKNRKSEAEYGKMKCLQWTSHKWHNNQLKVPTIQPIEDMVAVAENVVASIHFSAKYHCFLTAVYLINRLPTASLQFQVTYTK